MPYGRANELLKRVNLKRVTENYHPSKQVCHRSQAVRPGGEDIGARVAVQFEFAAKKGLQCGREVELPVVDQVPVEAEDGSVRRPVEHKYMTSKRRESRMRINKF